MFKPPSPTARLLFIGALIASCLAMTSCIESSFQLARESRAPKWIVIPPGLSREDVSVRMDYYTGPLVPCAKFILKDKKGKTLTKVSGKCRPLNPVSVYPHFEKITVNGTSEIIEHKKMEPIFYVVDEADRGNE